MSKWWPVAEEWDRISLWGADWNAKRNRDLKIDWDKINELTSRTVMQSLVASIFASNDLHDHIRRRNEEMEEQYGPFWRGVLERMADWRRRADLMEGSLGLGGFVSGPDYEPDYDDD